MEEKKCPKCGSDKIGQGKQLGQGRMTPIDKLTLLNSSNVIAEICTDCGYIIEMRVEKPDLFK